MNEPPFGIPEFPEGEPPPQLHQFQLPSTTARVPPSVGSGVFSMGAIIMTVRYAFVFDFLQQMGVPASVVCRIVLPHPVLAQFAQALEHNIGMFEGKYGPIPALPRPPEPQRRPTVQEIYENLRLPDEELPGHYADGVIIRHSPAEFCMEFVTHFFPHAAVARRVFFAALHIPQLLKSMKANLQQFRDSHRPSDEDPPTGEDHGGGPAPPPPGPQN